ncbi:unnamed protein product, partial [Adineta ricciae]
MDRCNRTRQKLANLNLFDTETNDEHVKRNEILSTRIHIILLFLSLLSSTLYLSLSLQSNLIVTINKPNIKQYQNLQMKYSNSLQCPCKHIVVLYKEFINITVHFYEICTSDFVSQRWIDYLFFENVSSLFYLDFRRSASARFQLLRTLCQQAENITDDYLEELYSKQFITNNLVSIDSLDLQISASIDTYRRNLVPLLDDLLELMRMIMIGNRLHSAIETIYYIHPNLLASIRYLEHLYMTFECFESKLSVSLLPEGIYANIVRYTSLEVYLDADEDTIGKYKGLTIFVPGMKAGCKPIESLMESTNECLFHQGCLKSVISYMNYSSLKNSSFTILNSSLSTRHVTIKELVKDLFIKDWIVNKSYEKYFSSCQPLFCQYTHDRRRTFIEISIALIGLYGGLEAILILIIPNVVTFIRRKKRTQPADANIIRISRTALLRLLCRSIINSLRNTNIFDSYSSEEHRRKSELISTKIYFLLLTTCLMIFTTYTAIEYQGKSELFFHPKQIDFEHLKNMSLNDFHCPCSQITIKHSTFISFNPIYHQICSSVFASNLWATHEKIWNRTSFDLFLDFRIYSGHLFSLLSALCNSSQRIIGNNLQQFNSTEFVASEVMNKDQFDEEISSLITLFINQIRETFREQSRLIQSVIAGNKILIEYPRGYLTQTTMDGVVFRTNKGLDCSCATQLTCQFKAGFKNFDESQTD